MYTYFFKGLLVTNVATLLCMNSLKDVIEIFHIGHPSKTP